MNLNYAAEVKVSSGCVQLLQLLKYLEFWLSNGHMTNDIMRT